MELSIVEETKGKRVITRVWCWDYPVCIAYCILQGRRSRYPRRTGRIRCRNNHQPLASPAAEESPSSPVWVGSGVARVY